MRLNLSEAGLEWLTRPETKEAERRSGLLLIDSLAASPTVLAGLQLLVVSSDSGFEVPVEKLRLGGVAANDALIEAAPFLSTDGGGGGGGGSPWRTELLLMADLLRKNKRASADAAEVDRSAAAVARVLDDAAAGKLDVHGWEARVRSLMVAGETRRAHFKSVVEAGVLRQVRPRSCERVAEEPS